jgi:hypothetical protein
VGRRVNQYSLFFFIIISLYSGDEESTTYFEPKEEAYPSSLESTPPFDLSLGKTERELLFENASVQAIEFCISNKLLNEQNAKIRGKVLGKAIAASLLIVEDDKNLKNANLIAKWIILWFTLREYFLNDLR